MFDSRLLFFEGNLIIQSAKRTDFTNGFPKTNAVCIYTL